MVNNGLVVMAILVPIVAYRWGESRRASGHPITLRDRWFAAMCAWAVMWPVTALPPAYRSPVMTVHDKLIVTAVSLGIAVAPLAVDALIRGALRVVRLWEAGHAH